MIAWRSSTSTPGAQPIPAEARSPVASPATCSGSRRPRSPSRRATAPRRCSAKRRARFRAGRGDSILVLNPSGHTRSDVVQVFCPASSVDPDRPLAVSRRRTERARAARVRACRSRAATGRRGGCSRSSPATCRASATGGSSSSRTRPRRRAEAGDVRERALPRGARGGGRPLGASVDLELGLDLVDAASAFGFGQVVRDLYGGPLQATRRVTSGTPVTDADGPSVGRADHGAPHAEGRRRRRARLESRSRSASRSARAPTASS